MAALSLSVEAVCHRHRGRAVDTPQAVSFELVAGERALLTGPNGSGKTTLLLRIVGLLEGPGLVKLGGEPMRGSRVRTLRRSVGFVWQDPESALLLPTVLEDVALGPVNDGLASAAARERALHWLERIGVAHLASRAVRELSGGEKQLVSLAGVLAREPGLLLLDEPTASLDQAHRDRLTEVLASLDATLLVVTHEPGWWFARGWRRAVPLAGPPASVGC